MAVPISLSRYGSAALVTGASSGIGASFAERVAASGFSKLILVARRGDRLSDLSQRLEATYNCQCVPITLDLGLPGSVGSLSDHIAQLGIEVDVLINNAGFGLLGSIETIAAERVSAMVELNCRAVADLARCFLPGMKERRRGAMVITSSVIGVLPAPWFSVYAATKAFDLYLGEALYGECKGSGVDVVTVLPGLTKTEFHAGAGNRQYHSPYRSAEQVVDTALRALGRKPIVVDGLFNKLLVHGSRFLPRNVALALSRAVMSFELR